MRTPRPALAALVLAAAIAAPFGGVAAAAPSPPTSLQVLAEPRLHASFAGAGSALLVTGKLVSATGRPLAGRTIQLTLDGVWQTSQTTARNGSFNFSHRVPAGTPVGSHEVVVSTDPVIGWTEATAHGKVTVGRLRTARLSAAIINPRGRASSSLVLSGRVTDTAGQALAGVFVQGHFPDGEWTDSFATDARGRFSGSFTIPADSTVGTATIQVVLDGLSGYGAKPVAVTYAVLPGSAIPSARAEPSATEMASPESVGTLDADLNRPTVASAPPAPVTPPTTPPAGGAVAAVPAGAWAMAGLVGIGLVVSVGMLGRGMGDEAGDEEEAEGRLIGGPD